VKLLSNKNKIPRLSPDMGESRGIFCLRWPTLGQQSGIGARSLPQSSGKQDYVSRQVEKNLTEVLLKADPKAQQVFTGREAIAEEQEKLNLLGFYGQNGKPLREDGILDQDTLLAWNDKTYGGVLLGSNNSPMAKAQREWNSNFTKGNSLKGDYAVEEIFSEEELRQVVNSDFNAKRLLSNEDDIREFQKFLNQYGYTNKDGEPIREDGILDEETFYAWFLLESTADSSADFDDSVYDVINKLTLAGLGDDLGVFEEITSIKEMLSENRIVKEGDTYKFNGIELKQKKVYYKDGAALGKIFLMAGKIGITIAGCVLLIYAVAKYGLNSKTAIPALGQLEGFVGSAIAFSWQGSSLLQAIGSYLADGGFTCVTLTLTDDTGFLDFLVSVQSIEPLEEGVFEND